MIRPIVNPSFNIRLAGNSIDCWNKEGGWKFDIIPSINEKGHYESVIVSSTFRHLHCVIAPAQCAKNEKKDV